MNKYKILNRYLPLTLAVIILIIAGVVYLYLNPNQKQADASWYSSSWGYRKAITIDHGKVSGTSTLTNFPMLFSVTDPDLKFTGSGGKVGLSTGVDMLFTSSDGITKLDHEIEKYSSTTGETIVWVEVPTLATSTDTILYVYFGNSGASDQQNTTGVWDSNYKGVWHLGDGDSTAANFYRDSTTNAKHGTLTDSNGDVTSVNGKLGNSLKFSGGPDLITTTESGQYNDFTICVWFKDTKTIASYERIVDKNYSTGAWLGRENLIANSWGGGVIESGSPFGRYIPLGDGEWDYMCSERNGTIHTVYGNGGVALVTGSVVAAQLDATTVKIGGRDTGSDPSDAYIDEVRVSNNARGSDWIRTEYNNQFSPGTFYAYGQTEIQRVTTLTSYTSGAGANWYNSSWGYRKAITIDHNKVSGTSTLSNFPMLFSLTDSDLKYTASGGKVGVSNGNDILFTSSDGTTKLDHELEKYSSTTGETIAWVRIPTLATTTDTTIFIYVGNSGASSQQNATGVWDSNYKGVWHLSDGVTFSANDSTSNALNGTVTGTTATNGNIYGSGNFNGSTSKIDVGTTGLPTSNVSRNISAWVNVAGYNNFQMIFNYGSSSNDNGFGFGFSGTSNKLIVGRYGGNSTASTIGIPLNTWVYVTVNYENDTVSFFTNSVQSGSYSFTGVNTTLTSARIGKSIPGWDGGDGDYNFNGKLDEVRISNTIRSEDWIKTEYNNQFSPASFYFYGQLQTEQRNNAGVKVQGSNNASLGWYSTSWGYRKSITIDHNKVSGTSTLSSFPLLFSGTDSDLKYTASGGKVGVSNGNDILFTSSDGTTKLDHELEKYSSTTGETIAWVRIPTLSTSTDSTIYIYFGNAGASDQQNTTGVWDSNYTEVLHFPNGTVLTSNDSTSNAHNATNFNTPAASVGKIDGAISYLSASNQYSEISDYADLDAQTFTVSSWFKTSTTGQYQNILRRDDVGSNRGFLFRVDNANKVQGLLIYGSFPSVTSSGTYTDGNWHYAVMTATFSSPNTTMELFVDGVSQGTNITAAGYPNITQILQIGIYSGGGENFNGSIDDVRHSKTNRSSEWIATEYNNQTSPGTFYSYGQLSSITRQDTNGTQTPAVKVRGGVKFR